MALMGLRERTEPPDSHLEDKLGLDGAGNVTPPDGSEGDNGVILSSHGDIVIFKSPNDHSQIYVKRLVALPGDWVEVSSDILKIPEGYCWVEGDNPAMSWDSRSFGPIPLGLIRGRVTHVIWPPVRVAKLERKIQAGADFQLTDYFLLLNTHISAVGRIVASRLLAPLHSTSNALLGSSPLGPWQCVY
ncbi:hypothetical protein KSP39_PZI008457 [Platanthera zijinensis]|uniref:Mitochondrial inner membrane protease subunit 2 n=1 Tax=Platanthera zijinensis TaxID=2320716 RepID=A0AAP0BLT4_9ASPA